MVLKRIKVVALALLGAVLLPIVFSKGASAAVPRAIVDELNQKCNGGLFFSKDYDGKEYLFEDYVKNNNLSSHWISSDPDGLNVVNSLRVKNVYTVNKKNRTLYLNFATMNCVSQNYSSAVTNAKILKNSLAVGLESNRPENISWYGEGRVFPTKLSGYREVKRSGVIGFSITEAKIDSMPAGDNWVKFNAGHCLRGYSDGNWPASQENGDNFCYTQEWSVKVNVKKDNVFKVNANTAAAVVNSKSLLNSSDVKFKNSTESNPQTANVGQWVSFRHKVSANSFNNKEAFTGATVYVTYNNKTGSYKEAAIMNASASGWNKGRNVSSVDVIRQGYLSDPLNASSNRGDVETFKITSDMVGRTICSYASYIVDGVNGGDKKVGANWFHTETTKACVYVPYNYEMTPCVVIGIFNCNGGDVPIPNDGTPPGGGEEVKIPGGGTPSKDTQYKITTWRVSADNESKATPTSYTDSSSGETCSNTEIYGKFYNGIENCKVVKQGSQIFNPGNTRVADYIPEIEPNVEFGTRYCVAISVSPFKMQNGETKTQQDSNSKWRHSAPVCIKITKQPKIQFWGNGVFSKAGIKTSVARTSNGNLGSWVEYESIVGTKISGFKTESSHETQNLSIQNFNSVASWGQGESSIQSVIGSVESRYPRKAENSANRIIEVYDDATKVLAAQTNPSKTRIIYGKNIRISGDIITVDHTASSISDFNQTIIIASGNIYIDNNVQQVDAWLISTGTIYTCSVNGAVKESDVTNENCGKPLKINGATISKVLKPWRTAGSEGVDRANQSSPAEIINQRADTLLWARAQSGADGKIVTTYTKELSVRY